jgi:hypothetical protein
MSDYEPRSRAGSALLAFLLDDSTRTGLKLVRYPKSSPALLYQAFVLMARRRFNGTSGLDPLKLVQDALVANGSASEERIRWADDVLKSALLVRPAKVVAIPRKHQDVVITILLQLVRESGMAADLVAALVRAAESRLVRLRRLDKARNMQGFMGSILRRPDTVAEKSQVYERGAVGRVPNSVVGSKLRALADFDINLADSYPEEPDEAAAAMIDAVFRRVLMTRFTTPLASDEIARFASTMASSIPDLPVSAVELTALVTKALGSGDRSAAVQGEDRLRAKVVIFMDTVEEMGLFGEEIDDLIGRAEESVRSDGYVLTARDSGPDLS